MDEIPTRRVIETDSPRNLEGEDLKDSAMATHLLLVVAVYRLGGSIEINEQDYEEAIGSTGGQGHSALIVSKDKGKYSAHLLNMDAGGRA